MKNTKIVLVAEWDGWCGACAAERPLVLTRTGRQRMRTWLTGAADDSRPLLLTCRLCGTGVDVPLEQDDPPVVVSEELPLAPEDTPVAVPVAPVSLAEPLGEQLTALTPVPTQDPSAVASAVPVPASAAELTAGREAVARALGSLLAARSAAAPAPAPVPAVAPALAPTLPLQRNPASAGLTELQLLADGIDLLSSGRA